MKTIWSLQNIIYIVIILVHSVTLYSKILKLYSVIICKSALSMHFPSVPIALWSDLRCVFSGPCLMKWPALRVLRTLPYEVACVACSTDLALWSGLRCVFSGPCLMKWPALRVLRTLPYEVATQASCFAKYVIFSNIYSDAFHLKKYYWQISIINS